MIVSFTWHYKAVLDRSKLPQHKISPTAFSAIYRAVLPIEVPGLKEVNCANVYPEKRAKQAAHVKVARYSAEKETLTATLVRSPEVSYKSPHWKAYRLAYVDELGSLFDELLVVAAERDALPGAAAKIEEARAACRASLAGLSSLVESGTA